MWVHLGITLTLKCWFGINAFLGTVASFLGARQVSLRALCSWGRHGHSQDICKTPTGRALTFPLSLEQVLQSICPGEARNADPRGAVEAAEEEETKRRGGCRR
jgi:hypothetical protein